MLRIDITVLRTEVPFHNYRVKKEEIYLNITMYAVRPIIELNTLFDCRHTCSKNAYAERRLFGCFKFYFLISDYTKRYNVTFYP